MTKTIYTDHANAKLLEAKQVGNYEFVTEDIEGQNRPGIKTIGCDEPSEGEKEFISR
ncbi:MAG: hypothetical protein MZW92_25790 [Comamonadaceae bacterium]|nr:hypothetical protein [Comamonadaceae bacterium]